MTAGAALKPPGARAATTAMGTWFEVWVTDGRSGDRAAAEAAIETIEDAHRRLSRFEATSLVSHLRRVAPMPVPVDRDTLLLFERAERVRVASGGAFDATIRGLGITLDLAAGTVALPIGADLDLGGIAKGHAIDLAVAMLRDAGVHSAFVHGGTSSGYGVGAGPDGPWRVRLGLDGPAVALADRAFSVSSTAQRRHIVDPRSGQLVPKGRHVALLGPNAALADAWSTALLVAGPEALALEPGWNAWHRTRAGAWRPVAGAAAV